MLAYVTRSTPCSQTQGPLVQQGLPGVRAAVAGVVGDVRATMRAAGYADGSYRLILQSYPSPWPPTARSRFAGDTTGARVAAGCPTLDVDADWVVGTLVPGLRDAVRRGAARDTGVQFLDLGDAFDGHELCATTDAQVTGRPRSATAEWVRFVDLAGQGDDVDSLHPNFYGQQAIGRCLDGAVRTRQDVACHAVPGLGTWAVHTTGDSRHPAPFGRNPARRTPAAGVR